MASEAEVDAVVAGGQAAVEALGDQVKQTRERRRAAERTAQRAVNLRAAIATAARDRDALTSPTLDAERRRVDALAGRLGRLAATTDRIRDHVNRLGRRGIAVLDDPLAGGGLGLREALDAERLVRDTCTEQLSAAGLDSWVSLPPTAALLDVPDEQRRNVHDLLETQNDELRDDDAGRRRTRRGHDQRRAASHRQAGAHGPR